MQTTTHLKPMFDRTGWTSRSICACACHHMHTCARSMRTGHTTERTRQATVHPASGSTPDKQQHTSPNSWRRCGKGGCLHADLHMCLPCACARGGQAKRTTWHPRAYGQGLETKGLQDRAGSGQRGGGHAGLRCVPKEALAQVVDWGWCKLAGLACGAGATEPSLGHTQHMIKHK